jgi:signal transduction histidine kinase
MSADDLPPDSAQREVLERIHGASERARDIVARILAFSRQEKPSFERFELKCLVKDALALARSSLPPNIALSVDMADGDLPVDADRVQVESLFLNIFNNAAAAIGAAEDGRIEIGLGQENLGPRRCQLIDPELQEGRYAALVIKDNGSGMDEHTLAHIFDPFFTTKDVGEGTGLGLSMAHGIIHEHEGAITVDSKPGRGTLFTIYLPLSDA